MNRAVAAWMARIGYGARGLVFLIIGLFAVAAAIGWRSRPLGTGGVFSNIATGPWGDLLIGAVALGFSCFAGWRFLQALFDADKYGHEPRGLARRIGFGVSAVVYAGLAVWAATFLFMMRSGQQQNTSTLDWTAWLMAFPFGRWLVGAVGVAAGLVGLASAIRGWRAEFEKRLDLAGKWGRWAVMLGRVGFFARAFVFLLIGALIVIAAWRAEPGLAAGFSGALRSLGDQPFGWILLGVTAIGIVAFGLFELFQAIFHRLDRDEPL